LVLYSKFRGTSLLRMPFVTFCLLLLNLENLFTTDFHLCFETQCIFFQRHELGTVTNSEPLDLDFTSLYWGNFVWISSNLGVQYWKSVIVIDVFLGYFKHYCISVSIPLNDTGRYRKGRACQLRTLKNRNSVTTKVKSHGLYELKSGMFAKSTQVTWTPLLGLHSLEWKTTDLHFKNWSEESLVMMRAFREISVACPKCYTKQYQVQY
jgi:hypothetical protein